MRGWEGGNRREKEVGREGIGACERLGGREEGEGATIMYIVQPYAVPESAISTCMSCTMYTDIT